MKQFFRIFIPIILSLAIILCLGWYLFIYDREFTRDALLHGARYFDSQGNYKAASWCYDRAYEQSGDNDVVAIELAQQHKNDGNYTQAENTLSRAIEDGGGIDLYIELSKTYVEQDKLIDAVKLLNGITNPDLKAELDAMRPAVPTAFPEPGFYNQYISVDVQAQSGTLLVNAIAEYPSVHDTPYAEPIALGDGENTIYAVAVGENGLVSPLGVFGYTVGGVIEEITFADAAVEAHVRQMLGLDETDVIFSNDLWDISYFDVPVEAKNYEDLRYMIFLENLIITDGPSGQLDVLSSLTNLKSLSITNTAVSSEDIQLISNLAKLENLTLSGGGVSSIAGFEKLTAMKNLDLSNNSIRNISPIASMTGLQTLYLQENALTDLSALSGLSGLTTLDISYNAVDSLVPLSSLTALSWLDVSYNSLTDLICASTMTGLQYLAVSNNAITDVSSLATLTGLTELRIGNNIITDITSLASLVKLTYFDFSYNQVTALPAFPTDCALVTINGSYNQLPDLEALRELANLNNVFMDYNEAISSVECLAKCPVLIQVDVYGTAVTEVTMLTDQSIIVNFNPTQEEE